MSESNVKKSKLTVGQILQSRYLSGISRVVAGKSGLDKPVSWVHVLEIRDVIKESVDDDVMVLTTGIGFTDTQIAIDFVKSLIAKNVSALCIETALYYRVIDQELKTLADDNSLVLVEIPVISRFVDISKGVNTMILESENKLYNMADHYEEKLAKIDTMGTLADGIRYTARYLNVEIAYIPKKGKHISTSEDLGIWKNKVEVFNDNKNEEIYVKGRLAIKAIKINGKMTGYLLFNGLESDISHFDIMIMERLATEIELSVKQRISQTEERIFKENVWVKDWLNGQLNAEEIEKRLKEFLIIKKSNEIYVLAIKIEDFHFTGTEEDADELARARNKSFYLHNALIIKKLFEESDLISFGYAEGNLINYIIINNRGNSIVLERIEEIVQVLIETKDPTIDYKKAVFAVGKNVHRIEEVKKSSDTALQLLKENKYEYGKLFIYDKLKIDRILKYTDKEVLDDMINDTLKELLEPENKDLLETLRIYLSHNCNKQKTASALFIVRQTLYFRLQKIEEILGNNYDEGDNRLIIELAIRAYEYRGKQ